MTKERALEILQERLDLAERNGNGVGDYYDVLRVAIEAIKQQNPNGRMLYQSGYQQGVKDGQPKWIPIRWHDITDEEREREGYPKEWLVHVDCDMPNDGDEILVQTKRGLIRWDVCYEDGEYSLNSGWDWMDDIVAWMPLPEPWEGEE